MNDPSTNSNSNVPSRTSSGLIANSETSDQYGKESMIEEDAVHIKEDESMINHNAPPPAYKLEDDSLSVCHVVFMLNLLVISDKIYSRKNNVQVFYQLTFFLDI